MKKIVVFLAVMAMASVAIADDELKDAAERYNEIIEFMSHADMPTIKAKPGSAGDIFKETPQVIIIQQD